MAIARETKDRAGEIEALIGLGYIRSMRGWYGEATEYLEYALDPTRAQGDKASELAALIGLGFANNQRRFYAAAAGYDKLALDLACEVDSSIDELSATLGLGIVNRGRGRLNLAASGGLFQRIIDDTAEALADSHPTNWFHHTGPVSGDTAAGHEVPRRLHPEQRRHPLEFSAGAD